MSQTAIFVEVNGILYDEVLSHIPQDHEEVIGICMDMEMENDDCDVEYEWYEIGEGESGTDNFFKDEQLLGLKRKGDFENEIEKLGYRIELVESASTTIYATEIESEEYI